jgi:hypothetical protein
VAGADVAVVLDDPFGEIDDLRDELLDEVARAAGERPVVLLTDDPATLGWAISLPDEVGTVTRLAVPTESIPHPSPQGPTVAAEPRPVG